jgi:hypothetical protein
MIQSATDATLDVLLRIILEQVPLIQWFALSLNDAKPPQWNVQQALSRAAACPIPHIARSCAPLETTMMTSPRTGLLLPVPSRCACEAGCSSIECGGLNLPTVVIRQARRKPCGVSLAA